MSSCYEGPDQTGIDCALLYDPKQFSVTHSKLVLSTPFEGDTLHLTRGFLIVDGQLAGERVCVIVNHWPSRGAKSPVRVHAARQVKALKDSLMRSDKKLKLIVMGDMNDDPMDESMKDAGCTQISEAGEERQNSTIPGGRHWKTREWGHCSIGASGTCLTRLSFRNRC